MYIFECKECGGRNEVETGSTYMTCAYCGKQITLPTIQDEERARLFNRANYFRRQGEFDKAISAFAGIVNQDGKDPEATWGLVLAKYGIEYVEDPRSGERIPTCNRVSNNSILTDSDYLATLDNSKDEYTRSLYVKEAERIDKIQKGILAIANQEEPFDVFICYKESTGGGSRTEDSVLAQDIYSQLIKEGLRVFFSRITLEDKLGQQYEPYIFAALNSAKVMLVVATDKANVMSVWVKNEWGRFLALMKSDHTKVLIPCYKKMSVYDFPEELNIYQSLDLSQIGAMQTLVHGVSKICSRTKSTQANAYSTQDNTQAMLDRGFICLRDADFDKADLLFEQVLNLNPHDANAYLGKLMVERRVCVEDNLAKEGELLQKSVSYKHCIEYADDGLKTRILEYAKQVEERVLNHLHTRLNDEYPVKKNNIIRRIREWEDAKRSASNDLANKEEQHLRAQEELQVVQKKVNSWGLIRLVIGLVLLIWVVVLFHEMNGTGSWLSKLPWLASSLVGLSIIPSAIALVGIIISSIFGGERRKEERDRLLAPKQQAVYTTQEQIRAAEDRMKSAEVNIETNKAGLARIETQYSDLLERVEAGNDDIVMLEEDVSKFLR